ncbi:MAG TPA: hypothetical protein VF316_13750 [Polyangiaceae bacterium]
MRLRLHLVLLLAPLLLAGCRVHTTYDGAATSDCMKEANTGVTDPVRSRERFDLCCHRRGLDSVEPGSQSCGKLGLDALLK